jgi:hypothetical protein
MRLQPQVPVEQTKFWKDAQKDAFLARLLKAAEKNVNSGGDIPEYTDRIGAGCLKFNP